MTLEKNYQTIVMLGSVFSGKTCFLMNYNNDNPNYDVLGTIGTDFYKIENMRIWELGGACKRLVSLYINLAQHAYIIMFNNADLSTFIEIEIEWIPQIKKQNKKNLPIYLLENSFNGNKVVSDDEINKLIFKYNLRHKLVSKTCLIEIKNELLL